MHSPTPHGDYQPSPRRQFRLIEDDVILGTGITLEAFAAVKAGSTLGNGVRIGHFAVVGGDPQYRRFDPSTRSGVTIGAETILREGVTISRSIHEQGQTTIGAHCFLMANSHVGHDCRLGEHVVLANGALLGGHVTVGDHVFIGGNAAVHQFCRVGEGAMIGGVSRITYDVPPFVTAANHNEVAGLNLIGLKRRSFTTAEITDLKRCYRAVYLSQPPGDPAKKAAAADAAALPQTDKGSQFLAFFNDPETRGYIRRRVRR